MLLELEYGEDDEVDTSSLAGCCYLRLQGLRGKAYLMRVALS
jgi:hypothetical protein